MGAKVSWTENSVTVTGPPRDHPSKRTNLRAIDVNMNKMPDVAMTLAVVALFADGPTTIRDGRVYEMLQFYVNINALNLFIISFFNNIYHPLLKISLILSFLLVASWRVKETERMIAICTELRKVCNGCIYKSKLPMVSLRDLRYTLFFFSLELLWRKVLTTV